jgi:hypothetical protein
MLMPLMIFHYFCRRYCHFRFIAFSLLLTLLPLIFITPCHYFILLVLPPLAISLCHAAAAFDGLRLLRRHAIIFAIGFHFSDCQRHCQPYSAICHYAIIFISLCFDVTPFSPISRAPRGAPQRVRGAQATITRKAAAERGNSGKEAARAARRYAPRAFIFLATPFPPTPPFSMPLRFRLMFSLFRCRHFRRHAACWRAAMPFADFHFAAMPPRRHASATRDAMRR